MRRETGRRYEVKVLCGEGVASHTDPESCAAIGEDGLRPGERPLGVDEPIEAAQRRERGVEGVCCGERGEAAEEDEATSLV